MPLLMLLSICLSGCASLENSRKKQDLEERWGIRVESLRLTAAEHMLDFRYKVIDPDKALTLLNRQNKPYLIDEATGKIMPVPSPPKIGPLRQSAVKPEANRIYFILFKNMDTLVKRGNKVTVVIGDFKVENLTVE